MKIWLRASLIYFRRLCHDGMGYAAALVPGAWFGAKLGAWLNARIASKTAVLLLRLVLILVGVRLIWQGIH
ncbi:hypothetical protein [Domibacillus tundrae]|uniref:hypothetical protein n=1 Tax=Domibacillus tundrae TaxID=1587527 RepID=UPI00155A6D1D|nr:hypothetical protein [Domibacillus tundrae]